ncbi:MAG: spondin domain-containing protein [Rhodothermales bacterium]|nr:spondin domain-containing protein [Rhodothermales bacterium]
MKFIHTLTLVAALTFAGCQDSLNDANSVAGDLEASSAANEKAYGGGDAVYQVRVRNVTKGQPFTPPLAVTHSAAADLFSVGDKASVGIMEIAENGNLDPLLAALTDNPEIGDLVVAVDGDVPPLLAGEEVTFEITSTPGKRHFSFAAMLICTNDGFTGVDSQLLPRQVGEEIALGINGYDAGTELNTEDFADIVPPCQGLVGISSDDAGTGMSNPALAENGSIAHHPGVEGGDDLVPAVHGWNDPVAKVHIRRIR